MIRKPLIREADQIRSLIEPFVRQGLILPRSLHSIYTSIRDFWVNVDDDGGAITGCCALHVTWLDMAEIRTLAVSQEKQGGRIGRSLVEACMDEARSLGVKRVFTLTYVPDFFRQMGFVEVDKTSLPNKIWADCIHCQYFPECKEVALVYDIEE